MEIVIYLIFIIVIIYLLSQISHKNNEIIELEEKTTINEQEHNEKALKASEYPTTPQIIFGALQSLGCQPELKDDNTLVVSYQGETFQFDFGESPSRYTRVWDPFWANIKQDDPDFPLIREAINVSNYNFGPTIVMTEPDENNVVNFHCRYDIMVHPACPDNDQYLQSVLNSFFSVKDAVRANFHNLNDKQTEKLKNRRPIGFQKTS